MDWAHFPGVIVGDEAVDLVALHMVLSWSRQEAIVWARSRGHARLARLPHGLLRPARRRAGDASGNEKTAVVRGAGAWGTINPTYRRYAGLMKFHVDACAPRQPQRKGKVERRVRDQRAALDPYVRTFRDLAELQAWTDARLAERSGERRCPATGTSVAEAWAQERCLLTPMPETMPEPFDLVAARRVGRDALVAFEGRQYSVPFRLIGSTVEVRGAADAVQVLKDCEIVACHPRGTERRLIIDQHHYDGPSTERVLAPPPLGRMGTRIQELATMPVARRSIDLSAALAEVAR